MKFEEKSSTNVNLENNQNPFVKKGLPCSIGQLLAIFIPLALLGLFCAIFLPIYLTRDNHRNKVIIIPENSTEPIDNNSTDINYTTIEEKEFDEFEEYVENYTYAILTPKDGYDNILIFLVGISNVANQYFDFFKSNSTFVPKKTKIYFLAGKIRKMKFLEKYGKTDPAPGWFNVDSVGNLICDNCNDIFDEAKESLNIILDEIDQISINEKINYDKIYLAGFSQGAIMTNYVLLNSRHKLGGYMAFSGYILDHNFPYNYVLYNLTETQKQILESKKDYHILATHSFNDQTVYYPDAIETYYIYFREYTDFRLYSFGALLHSFIDEPVLPIVRLWLKESMGK